MKPYYVYFITNASHTLYVGVTNDLERRVRQHQAGAILG
ncbi:MAG: GIY-YIG nuclease family protein, partial [Armatimonadetes bacterium]|nr:GIY-YIG nuclease family protein [Armatimonadota bacterium]